jgi:hypothetical protein
VPSGDIQAGAVHYSYAITPNITLLARQEYKWQQGEIAHGDFYTLGALQYEIIKKSMIAVKLESTKKQHSPRQLSIGLGSQVAF